MGKRSNFERVEDDFYPTPLEAVPPLIPHLRGVRTFAEPCAGDGDLIRHLESFGLRCVSHGDIRTGQDALAVHHYDADTIITNPPYDPRPDAPADRALSGRSAPTWLLLDADWAHTQQAAPFLPRCSDIVAIGRVKWIEGSKHTGKDNYAWYRFVSDTRRPPIFHRRSVTVSHPIRLTRMCEHCRKPYEPQRSTSSFCSQTCKQRAYRDT